MFTNLKNTTVRTNNKLTRPVCPEFLQTIPKLFLKIIACGFKITFDPSYVCTLTIITTAMINIKQKNTNN